MIIVTDDFFGEETFKALQDYCENDFQIVEIGGKEFSVLQTPDALIPLLEVNGYELTFTFIRNAWKDFDTDLRIHADSIINGKKTDIASVHYINPEDGVTKNGTSFWKHVKYGRRLPKDIADEEFDRILQEDSNDDTKWIRESFINSVPNRRVLYDADMFHSKMPSVIEQGVRIVLVCFYSKKDEN